MSKFNPGVITIGGYPRRYSNWLRQYARSGDIDGMRALLSKVIEAQPNKTFDPAQVKVYSERIAGLSPSQVQFVDNLFAELTGDRAVAGAISRRNATLSLRTAADHSRSIRVSRQIESLQVGPKSVILVEVDPDASQAEVDAMARALQATFSAAVIVRPNGIRLHLMDVQELTRLRDSLNAILGERAGGK